MTHHTNLPWRLLGSQGRGSRRRASCTASFRYSSWDRSMGIQASIIRVALQLAVTGLPDPGGRERVKGCPPEFCPDSSLQTGGGTQRRQGTAERCDGNDVQSVCTGFTQADEGWCCVQNEVPGKVRERGGRERRQHHRWSGSPASSSARAPCEP